MSILDHKLDNTSQKLNSDRLALSHSDMTQWHIYMLWTVVKLSILGHFNCPGLDCAQRQLMDHFA